MLNSPTDRLVKPIHLMPASARARLASTPTPLQARLQRELKGDVLFDRASRGRYATDASIYQIMPLGVVVPKDQAICASHLQIARDSHAHVLARGAGTSQCGQTVGEALVIDTTKWLNNIVHFDKDARTVTVEPGVVLDHLNAWLKPHGLWFPVDVSTSAQCTIGGMAGNNSCGSRSMEYGIMVHNVDAIDAILADGHEARFGKLSTMTTDARTRDLVDGVRGIALREQQEMREHIPKVLRRVAGYNLDLFDCQSPLRFQRRRRAESRESAGRFRRHARVQPPADIEARAAARAQDARRRELPDLLRCDGHDAAHREARTGRGGTGRSHDDRSRDVESRVSSRRSKRRWSASRRRSCSSNSRARTAMRKWRSSRNSSN